jgi:hypothetical protein
MIPSTAKAESLVRKLEEHLGFRLEKNAGLNSIRALKDSQGWPALALSVDGDESAEEPVCLIRIKGIDAVSPDIFGNSFAAFAPHNVDVVYDAAALAHKDLAIVLHEVTKLASKTQIREVAPDAAVTIASADSAAIVASLEHELRWPTKSV